MIGDMGLEVMNSNHLELRWKLVKRGRSCRKSSGRSVSGATKSGDFASPKRVGDFSGSDSRKIGVGLLRESNSGKLDSVPIKKRRHLLSKDSISQSNNPSLEDSWQPDFATGDFSGIELLAAAASMDYDSDNCGQIIAAKDSSVKPKTSDASFGASSSEICVKSNESEKFSSNMLEKGVDADPSIVASHSDSAFRGQCRSTESDILPKAVKREHWDLNVLMEAWDEPHDTISGLKDLNDHFKMTKELAETSKHVVLDAGNCAPAKSRLDEDNSVIISPDETSIKFSSTEAHHGSNSIPITSESSSRTTEDGSSGSTDDKLMWSDACEKTQDRAVNTNDKHVSAISPDMCCLSSTSAPDGKVKSSGDGVDISLLVFDSKDQTNGEAAIGSAEGCSQDHSALAYLVPGHEDENHLVEEPARMEGSSRSFIAGALAVPVTSDGIHDSAKNAIQDSDVSQSHCDPIVQGNNLTAVEEGHDSPYEDGELRCSYMHSWEENECVDYESDGRNEYEKGMDDLRLSDLAEVDSETSHGIETRNLVSKGYPEVEESKCGPVEPFLMNKFAKDDCDDDEVGGKGSNAGSGTTVEQSMEMIEENGDSRKRRHYTDSRFEYPSNSPKGKLVSQIKRRSLMDAGDTNGSLFTQQSYRSRQHGSIYSRLERDMSPNKFIGKHGSAHGATVGPQWTSWTLRRCRTSDDRIWGAYGPNRSGNISNGTGERYFSRRDFLDSRQGDNYLSRGVQRCGPGRSSIEREDYVGFRRRMPLKRGGGGGFRSRGHYLHHHSEEGFECGDDGLPARFPHSPSVRNPNFSEYPSRGSSRRSRSRSPRMWHPRRKYSRSPDYRQDFRMEDYMSAPRGRMLPQENYRFIEDSGVAENHSKRRRPSPLVGAFRRPQRQNPIETRAHLKPDEYHKSGNRPRRFSPMDSGRGNRLESDYTDRRRDSSVRMIH